MPNGLVFPRDGRDLGMIDCKRFNATLRLYGGDLGRLFWNPMPGHQFVDALLGPAVDQARQQVGDVELRIDAVELKVYAARRTMPNSSGMTHGCRGAVGCRVAVGSVPFGIV